LAQPDISDLRRLSLDLRAIPGRAVTSLNTALGKSAQSIRDGMAATASASQHRGQNTPTISDKRTGPLTYEIGPDASAYGGTGALGHLDIDGPLADEEQRLLRLAVDLAKDWL